MAELSHLQTHRGLPVCPRNLLSPGTLVDSNEPAAVDVKVRPDLSVIEDFLVDERPRVRMDSAASAVDTSTQLCLVSCHYLGRARAKKLRLSWYPVNQI